MIPTSSTVVASTQRRTKMPCSTRRSSSRKTSPACDEARSSAGRSSWAPAAEPGLIQLPRVLVREGRVAFVRWWATQRARRAGLAAAKARLRGRS